MKAIQLYSPLVPPVLNFFQCVLSGSCTRVQMALAVTDAKLRYKTKN